jgi:hypothetical protein
MVHVIPFFLRENSTDDEDHLEPADVDLEKIPKLACTLLSKWYQFPALRTSLSSWEFPPKWRRLSLEDMPMARTALSCALSYTIAALLRFLQQRGLKITGEVHPTAYPEALRGSATLFGFYFHAFCKKRGSSSST